MIKELLEKVSKIFHDKYVNISVDFNKYHWNGPKDEKISVVWRLYISDRDEGGNFPTFDALKKYVDELQTSYVSEQMLVDEGKE